MFQGNTMYLIEVVESDSVVIECASAVWYQSRYIQWVMHLFLAIITLKYLAV